MLGHKDKEIPMDKVVEMQNQGMQNSDIISNLQKQGYNHDQISNAMNQASVKSELSRGSSPIPDDIGQGHDIPLALMNAPSPSSSSDNQNSNQSNDDMGDLPPLEPHMQTPQFDPSQQPSMAPEPLERGSYDAIEEIAESIVKEKWDEMIRSVGDIKSWKEKIDIDLEGVKQEIVRTQEKFENLQKALLGKINEYSSSVGEIGIDMRALEKVLGDVLSPLSRSVRELQDVTEDISRKRTTRKRKSPTRKKRKTTKKKKATRKKKTTKKKSTKKKKSTRKKKK